MPFPTRRSTSSSPIRKKIAKDELSRTTHQRPSGHGVAAHQLTDRNDPTRLPKDFSYEPELFPAVMFRRHGMHFICHLSGKTIITGIKRSSDLDDICNVLLELALYL
jgi:hypothetical protein